MTVHFGSISWNDVGAMPNVGVIRSRRSRKSFRETDVTTLTEESV